MSQMSQMSQMASQVASQMASQVASRVSNSSPSHPFSKTPRRGGAAEGRYSDERPSKPSAYATTAYGSAS